MLENRLKVFYISGYFLREMFTMGLSKNYEILKGLPKTTVFMYAFPAQNTHGIGLVFADESFDELKLGQEIPILEIKITITYRNTNPLADQ